MTRRKNIIPALLLIAVGLLLMALGTRGDRPASWYFWQEVGFFAAVGLAAAAAIIMRRRRAAQGRSERGEDGTDDSTK